MTKEEFNAKMNKKDLDDIAEEKVAAFVASECKDVDVLFSAVDRQLIDPADAVIIRSVLTEAICDILNTDKKKNHLRYVLGDASDAMNVVFMKMLHSMRKEYDYSGLGLLYESCGTDLPFRIYQTLGDMIFNDHFPEINPDEYEKVSPLFRVFYDRFDEYFADLLNRADAAWNSYLQPADVDDDEDDEGEELTFEQFRRMIADSEDEDDAADDLMPSVVQLRIMKCTAYLMALSESAGNDISDGIQKKGG